MWSTLERSAGVSEYSRLHVLNFKKNLQALQQIKHLVGFFCGGGNDSDSGRPETSLGEGSLTVAEIVCIGFVMKESGGYSVGCQWGSLFSFDSASNPCKQPRGCLLAPSHPGWMVWREKRLRVNASVKLLIALLLRLHILNVSWCNYVKCW